MHIAFYAPMKPPDDPRPSGDREMARHLLAALAGTGCEVRIASHLSSYDGTGDAVRQARLAAAGRAAATALIAQYRAAPVGMRPALWFTYHLYHKAPDWLGPSVTRALGIPYVVAEASHAAKQARGPWARGHRGAGDAIATADLLLVLNLDDIEGLQPLIDAPARLASLPPFIDIVPFTRAKSHRDRHRRDIARRLGPDAGSTWLITAAMMRPGAKLRSYRLLAEALARLDRDRPGGDGWRLIIAGDGPARTAVEDAFRPVARRIAWLGEVAHDDMPALFAAADMFVWPAIDEAFGVALIEAQAAGLPVVAGCRPGIGPIVADGISGFLPPVGDAEAFARAVAGILEDAAWRRRMGAAAAAHVRSHHGLAAGAKALARILAPLLAPPDRLTCRGG